MEVVTARVDRGSGFESSRRNTGKAGILEAGRRFDPLPDVEDALVTARPHGDTRGSEPFGRKQKGKQQMLITRQLKVSQPRGG